jgi:hypothetical protein
MRLTAEMPGVIIMSQEVYKGLFSEKLFLAQLVYTDDISAVEIEKTRLLKEAVILEEVKSYFQKAVDNYWHETEA